MNRKYLIILITTVFILLYYGISNVYGNSWREEFEDITGNVLCIGIDRETGCVYTGTESGLYAKYGKLSWEQIDLPEGVFAVTDIAVRRERLFIAADGDIYLCSGNDSWSRVSGIDNVTGITVLGGEDMEDTDTVAWNRDEIFLITPGLWQKIKPAMISGEIDDVACKQNVMHVFSGGNIFYSSDKGVTWDKITLLKNAVGEEEVEEYEEEPEEHEVLPGTGSIYSYGPEGITVATGTGIFLLNTKDGTERIIDTTGLPSSAVKYAADTEKGIFVATDSRVFYYGHKEGTWRVIFERRFPGDISCLRVDKDETGRNWLWVGIGSYVYRTNIDNILEETRPGLLSVSHEKEPTVREVHQMAIDYAEVSPEKIKRWRTGAKWKAILPKLSVDFSESIDDNIEIYKSSTQTYVVTGPSERGTDWGIDLTWDLSDLIWNESQTSIDVRSKLMVQLRDTIIEEVTRLYFERKKVISQIDKMRSQPGESEVKKDLLLEKMLRLEELTAYIDGFTGGKFSENLQDQGRFLN